jgi:hypothetical protein
MAGGMREGMRGGIGGLISIGSMHHRCWAGGDGDRRDGVGRWEVGGMQKEVGLRSNGLHCTIVARREGMGSEGRGWEVGLISIGLLRTIVVVGRAGGKRVRGRMHVGWD